MKQSKYEFYCEIRETGLFQRVAQGDSNWTDSSWRGLLETDFSYNISHRSWIIQKVGTNNPARSVSFEYVLDNVPPDIQIQLLFHLDLFG